MTDAPDMRRLLAPLGAVRFFADHWQRRMLSFPLDPSMFADILDAVGPLDIARLAGAAHEGAQAWMANDYVAHSVIPINPANAAKFFDIGATLYFVNVPLPRLTEALADFLGAPRTKVIASLFLTPASGGAAPHFDKNENFTIQLTGAKRWIVGETPMVEAPPDGHVLGQPVPPSLAALLHDAPVPPERIVDLVPGTLLYVPRGTVHRTEAGVLSWSLNLSYAPAMWLDLFRIGLQRRLAQSPRWRGIVTGAGPGADPAAQAANRTGELADELRALLDDPAERDALIREFLAHPDA